MYCFGLVANIHLVFFGMGMYHQLVEYSVGPECIFILLNYMGNVHLAWSYNYALLQLTHGY